MVDVAAPNNRADGIFQHVYFYRDSRHFQHIPISTVEFSNTLQHEYMIFPIYFFTYYGILPTFFNRCRGIAIVLVLGLILILLQMSVIPIQQQTQQNHD
jgi:hypothetical protein